MDNRRHLTPRQECFDIPEIAYRLEGDRYGSLQMGMLPVKLLKTEAVEKFFEGLTEPRFCRIEVYLWEVGYESNKRRCWSGVLQNFPFGADTATSDWIELTFINVPGAWLDADDVKVNGRWYNGYHVEDIIEAIVNNAEVPTVVNVDEPSINSGREFWQGITTIGKHLIGGDYGATPSPVIAYDGSILYVAINGHVGDAYQPRVAAYNGRRWVEIARFQYTGDKPFLKPPTEWEISHLECSGGIVYYVVRTNHSNLLDAKAHYHARGSFTPGAKPQLVTFGDAALFTLHDRGIEIKSKTLYADNRLRGGNVPSEGGIDYYADAVYESIGWGTIRHTQKLAGVLRPSPHVDAYLVNGFYIKTGLDYLRLQRLGDKEKHPRVGDYVIIREQNTDFSEELGYIRAIKDGGNFFEVTLERSIGFWGVSNDVEIYLYRSTVLPSKNVFLAAPQAVSIRYLYPTAEASNAAAEIVFEQRARGGYFESFFYPRIIGRGSEGDTVYLDTVGYVTATSINDLDTIDSSPTYEKYLADAPAPFVIGLRGYNAAYLLADGLYTASALAASCYEQPAPCRLLYNGTQVKTNESEDVKTYGDIFLHKYGSKILVLWTTFVTLDDGTYRPVMKVGRWTGNRVDVVWTQDDGIESYPTLLYQEQGARFIGRQRLEREWHYTTLKIFWAAPPQEDIAPKLYEGGITAQCLVKGDQSSWIKRGDIIRLGGYGVPREKLYHVSDVWVAPREIGGGSPYAMPAEVPYSGLVTSFILTPIELKAAPAISIKNEVLGCYISVYTGRDTRAEILAGYDGGVSP